MNFPEIETWRPRRILIAGVRFATGATLATETPAPDAAAVAAKAAADATAAGKGTDADTAKAAADKAAADKTAADAAAAQTAAHADAAAKAKADEGKTPEQLAQEKAAKEAEDKAAAEGGKGKKAPDAYTLTVKDEAKDLIADDDRLFLEEVAKANEWTNEEAQAELDAHIARTEQKLAKQADAWANDTKADPVYGGEQLKVTQALARKAIDTLRPEGHPRRDSFMRFLNRGGAGNHIEVVSVLADLGKLFSEDAPNHGGPRAEEKTPVSDAKAIFGVD
jgi:hypothetical protein